MNKQSLQQSLHYRLVERLTTTKKRFTERFFEESFLFKCPKSLFWWVQLLQFGLSEYGVQQKEKIKWKKLNHYLRINFTFFPFCRTVFCMFVQTFFISKIYQGIRRRRRSGKTAKPVPRQKTETGCQPS